MALTVEQHKAWEQILKIASNAGFKEGVAAGNVPSGTGYATLLGMYQTAEGGSHPISNNVDTKFCDPKQK